MIIVALDRLDLIDLRFHLQMQHPHQDCPFFLGGGFQVEHKFKSICSCPQARFEHDLLGTTLLALIFQGLKQRLDGNPSPLRQEGVFDLLRLNDSLSPFHTFAI